MASREGVATRDVVVWDVPTRAFHWILVALVAVAVASGKMGHMQVHFAVGYGILTLLIFRVIWGFVGSQTARFSDFLKGPGAIVQHLRELAGRGGHAPTLGHNPLGGLMVVALLLALLAQAGTGLFTSDDILVDGPLVPLVSSGWVAKLSTVHRLAIDVILVMVGLHVLAVFAYLLVKRENLVRPMLTGRKALPGDAPVAPPRHAHPGLAVGILGLAAAVVWTILSAAG